MTFQILSLSGGGFFGLYTITVLAELEKELGRPLVDSFDLIAGTSVGGIIGLGLAFNVSPAKIKSAFEQNGTRIFSDRPVPRSGISRKRDLGRAALKPKYPDTGPLRETVCSLVGENSTIGDLSRRIIVPAVNLTKGRPQVFKTPHRSEFRRDRQLRIVDVALATAAAPTYFPLAQIGDELFADGGLYANSPDQLALHEATHFLGVPEGDIRILSVGTTTAQFSFSHAGGRNLGILGWFEDQRLINVIFSAQQQTVDYMLQHKLGERYLRIDETQSKAQERDLALDVATENAQRTMRGLAEGSVRRVINDGRLQAILAHTAAPPRFYTNEPTAQAGGA